MPSPQLAMSYDRILGSSMASRSEVIASHGMAATSQPLATQVALDILKQGGNAVDAAIAANAALALMEPVGCGPGGDLFAIVWDAQTKQLHGLNASGRSPASLTLRHFKEQGMTSIPTFGPLPVTVPGAVDGWFELHKRFGQLSMQQIMAPSIEYAREGFPLSELIADHWQSNAPLLKDYANFAETFMPTGEAPAKGDLFANPLLANTLESLAIEGRDVFYKGAMAHSMADYVQRHGGFLDYQDLASHKSEWIAPVSVNYRGYEVWELPPNGQGIAALQMLNILQAYDIAAMGFGSAEYLHLLIEAKKLAFADRAKFYADPAFNRIPVHQLISSEYAAGRRRLIDRKRAANHVAAGNANLEQGDTVYLTTADSAGNMVSLIQSNYRGMGSGMTPDGLGFVLHNRGQLFDLAEGNFNSYAPGKRPFHTIIPAFVTKHDKPYMSFGVMGADMQPQAHVQVLLNHIDFGMNLQEAGDAPRIRHSGSSEPAGEVMSDSGVVHLEAGFDEEVRGQLQQRGHNVEYSGGGYGGYQAILRDPERAVYFGASECRKDGQAAGY